MRIYYYLRVVGLLKASGHGVHHDSRIGVGEVALHLVLGHYLAGFRFGPGGLEISLDHRFAFCFARFLLCFPLAFLLSCLFGFALQLRFQLADLRQARLSLAHLSRQLIATFPRAIQTIFLLIDLLRRNQQARNFSTQLSLGLVQPLVAERLSFGRISLDLRAVDRHMAQLDQAGPLTQLQDLEEQTRERRQMTLAKFRNAVVIWMLVASQYPKGHIIISGLLKLARRQPPSAVTINQQLDHQRRMVRWPPPQVLFVTVQDLAQLQLINHVADVQCQMIVPQPLPQVWRHQQALIQIIRTKCFPHGPQSTHSFISVHGFFPTDS